MKLALFTLLFMLGSCLCVNSLEQESFGDIEKEAKILESGKRYVFELGLQDFNYLYI